MKNVKEVIAQLKREGAKEVKNCVIRSVKFTECGEYDRVCLTLAEPIPGMVEKDGVYEKGETIFVFTFPNVLRSLIAGDAKLSGIRKVMLNGEKIANLALAGSSVDILCEEVAGDVAYKNPFSDDEEEGKPLGHDTIVHHLIGLKPSAQCYTTAKTIETRIIDNAIMG